MARQQEAFIGARFGKLTVVGPRIPTRQATVPVRCDCGVEKVAYVHHLGVEVGSCGCVQPRRKAIRHGSYGSPEYRAWCRMIQRCTNPKDASWASHGGCGITVHPKFRENFEAFLSEVGERPTPTHSLDRIDVERGYEPGNLRWATPSEQARNKRPRSKCKNGHAMVGSNVKAHPNGARMCIACTQGRADRARAKRGQK